MYKISINLYKYTKIKIYQNQNLILRNLFFENKNISCISYKNSYVISAENSDFFKPYTTLYYLRTSIIMKK